MSMDGEISGVPFVWGYVYLSSVSVIRFLIESEHRSDLMVSHPLNYLISNLLPTGSSLY